MLRFGPPDGPVVVVAPALFEEANRTRAFLVRILRLLAADGITSILPDLPGTGESLRQTVDATLDGWRSAYAAVVRAANCPALAFAVRGGALVDTAAEVIGRYHLSSATGASVVRDLVRIRQAAAREDGERFDPAELGRPGPPAVIAGNLIDRALLAELSKAEPLAGSRTVRLATDPYPANLRLEGRPLWRASEPSIDVLLAEAVATDLAAWVRRCAG